MINDLEDAVIVRMRLWVTILVLIFWIVNLNVLINEHNDLFRIVIFSILLILVTYYLSATLFSRFIFTNKGYVVFWGIIWNKKIVFKISDKFVLWKDDPVVIDYDFVLGGLTIGFRSSNWFQVINRVYNTNFIAALRMVYMYGEGLPEDEEKLLLKYGKINSDTICEKKKMLKKRKKAERKRRMMGYGKQVEEEC